MRKGSCGITNERRHKSRETFRNNADERRGSGREGDYKRVYTAAACRAKRAAEPPRVPCQLVHSSRRRSRKSIKVVAAFMCMPPTTFPTSFFFLYIVCVRYFY